MSLSLYHIQSRHLALLSDIEEADGELSAHTEAELGFTEEALKETAASVGFAVKHLENDSKLIDEEISRLKLLQSRKVKGAEWLKEQIAGAMRQFGVEKIDTPTLKLSFRKSEAVDIDSEGLLPASCMVQVPESWKPDKKAIKEAIKSGQDIQGARLVTNQSLQIK